MGCAASCCGAGRKGEVKVYASPSSLSNRPENDGGKGLSVWSGSPAKSRIPERDRAPAWSVEDEEEEMPIPKRAKSAWLRLDDSDVDSDSDEEQAVVVPALDPKMHRRTSQGGGGALVLQPVRNGMLEPLVPIAPAGAVAAAGAGGSAVLPGAMAEPVPRRIARGSNGEGAAPGPEAPSSFSRAEVLQEAGELMKRGVTAQWLLSFYEEARGEFSGSPGFTTRELVERVVLPRCSSYGDMPFALTPGIEARKPQCFVSHSWDLPFQGLVASVERHTGGRPGAAVWIDAFALPPGCLSKASPWQRDAELAGAARLEVVAAAESTLLVLDKQATTLKQAWCLLEAGAAAAADKLDLGPYLLGRSCAKAVSGAIKALDISRAEAPTAAWRRAALRQAGGDPAAFNRDLRRRLLEALPGMVPLALQRLGGSAGDWDLATEVAGLAGLVLRAHGSLERAAEMLAQALRWLEEKHGSTGSKLGPTVNTLAMTRRDLGQLQSAEALYEQATRIAAENHGAGSDQALRALLNLAETRKGRGALESSAEAYRRILQATKGGSAARRIPSALGLAEVLRELGDTDGAAAELEQVLADVERQSIRDNTSSPGLVQVLKATGTHYKQVRDNDTAREYYDRAAVAQRKLIKAAGGRDCCASSLQEAKLELANVLNSLAAVTRLHTDGLRRAQEVYQEALALREEALPANHPSVLSSLLHIASIQKRRGLHSPAEETYRRALALMKEIQGPRHTDVAAVLANIGDCAREQEKLDQAEELYSQALQIREQALGPKHPDTDKLRVQISRLTNREGGGRRAYGRSESLAWSSDQSRKLLKGLAAITETSRNLGKRIAVAGLSQGRLKTGAQLEPPLSPSIYASKSGFSLGLRRGQG